MSEPNFKQQAREFAATHFVTLTDKQWTILVKKLATLLEYNYTVGKRDGTNG